MSSADLRSLIRDIPDFPKPGIGFKDITPLLADPDALRDAVRRLADHARPLDVDCVVAAELLDEVAERCRRPAGREQVVVHEHPRPARESVGVQLEHVDSVLQDVLRADRLRGKLAGLAGGREAGAQLACERAAEDEPARLRGEDHVHVQRPGVLGERADGMVVRARLEQ